MSITATENIQLISGCYPAARREFTIPFVFKPSKLDKAWRGYKVKLLQWWMMKVIGMIRMKRRKKKKSMRLVKILTLMKKKTGAWMAISTISRNTRYL